MDSSCLRCIWEGGQSSRTPFGSYEGSLIEDAKTVNPKHSNISIDEAIGAVAGHEMVHATDKDEINKDIEYEMKHNAARPDCEVKPNAVENKIIQQYNK